MGKGRTSQMDHPKRTYAALAVASITALSAACSAPPPTGYQRRGNASNGGAGDGGLVFGEDPSGVLGSSCATATSSAARTPVYMLIVLDGSGSMSQDNKWYAVVPALDAFFDDLQRQGDPSFGVGMTVFSDTNDKTGNAGPYDKADVPIRFVDATQAAALHARLAGAMPDNNTPTYAVLSGQYPVMDRFVPPAPLEAGGKRVLVLMTDGVPNGGAPEQAQCVGVADSEHTNGVLTFAVGIGNVTPYDPTSYDPLFMGKLAHAGGAPNAGCSLDERTDPSRMCHFQVTPGGRTAQQIETDFLAAINAVRGAALSCEYRLEATSNDQVDPLKVNVIYTNAAGKDALVPQGSTNGWTYDNPSAPRSVVLHGAACSTVRSDPHGKIKIVLGCKTVVK